MLKVNSHELYKLNHRTNDKGVTERRCTKCQEWKEENADNLYYVYKKKLENKFVPECKICAGIRSRNITLQNPERRVIYDKKFNATQKRIEYTREKHVIQRDLGYFKEYMKRPEVKAKKYYLNHRNHEISSQEWISCKNYFIDKDGDWSCSYCGLKIQDHWITIKGKLVSSDFHKEHVDDEGYNDLRNCIPACRDCNGFKHQFNMEKWYKKQISFTEERYNKIVLWVEEGYKDYIEDKPPYRIKRKKNEDNNKFHWQLWTVDEYRNMIECIATADKKKDLDIFIKEYFNKV